MQYAPRHASRNARAPSDYGQNARHAALRHEKPLSSP
jgi:hypothetical protein